MGGLNLLELVAGFDRLIVARLHQDTGRAPGRLVPLRRRGAARHHEPQQRPRRELRDRAGAGPPDGDARPRRGRHPHLRGRGPGEPRPSASDSARSSRTRCPRSARRCCDAELRSGSSRGRPEARAHDEDDAVRGDQYTDCVERVRYLISELRDPGGPRSYVGYSIHSNWRPGPDRGLGTGGGPPHARRAGASGPASPGIRTRVARSCLCPYTQTARYTPPSSTTDGGGRPSGSSGLARRTDRHDDEQHPSPSPPRSRPRPASTPRPATSAASAPRDAPWPRNRTCARTR